MRDVTLVILNSSSLHCCKKLKQTTLSCNQIINISNLPEFIFKQSRTGGATAKTELNGPFLVLYLLNPVAD